MSDFNKLQTRIIESRKILSFINDEIREAIYDQSVPASRLIELNNAKYHATVLLKDLEIEIRDYLNQIRIAG